eukprot:6217592-Alexandrium_andersonii.AAC.1
MVLASVQRSSVPARDAGITTDCSHNSPKPACPRLPAIRTRVRAPMASQQAIAPYAQVAQSRGLRSAAWPQD